MKESRINEIIAIGDIHGRKEWKEIVQLHPDAHLVFLGDYCDPYGKMNAWKVLTNLEDIVALKKAHPEQVTLLLGNHDVHYFVHGAAKGSRFDPRLASLLQELFVSCRDCFDYAFEDGRLLFTHAGISQIWLDKCFRRTLPIHPAEILNHPEQLGTDEKMLYTCGPLRMGPDPAGGIFWADEEELEILPKGWIQVAGHNQMDDIRHIHSFTAEKNEIADLFLCDCLKRKKYLRITLEGPSSMKFYNMTIGEEEGELIYKIGD